VLLALLAAAGGVAVLLLREGEGRGERKAARERAAESGREPVAKNGAGADPLPEPAPESLPAFVRACRERGDEAVPLLLRRLRLDPDRRFAPLWKFEKGRLVGYPTLRSAYIAALAGIPGESATTALQQILPDAKSVEESYQIALALAERGAGGWSDALLARATTGTAANQQLRMEMAEFVARTDPEGAAALVLESAPRGDSADDGRILAAAVTALPLETAVATTGRVLDDAGITARAKSTLVRSVLRRRPEPSVFASVEEQMAQGRLDDRLKVDAAYAAANSIWFVNDVNDYESAVAQGDAAKADEVRRRFNERARAARSLIRAAVGPEDDKRAQAILRILEAHEKRMGDG